MTPKPTYSIVPEALPDDLRPPEIRIRQILKLCLRGFRMKCTEITEVKPAVQVSADDLGDK